MTEALQDRTDNKIHNEFSIYRFLEPKWPILIF